MVKFENRGRNILDHNLTLFHKMGIFEVARKLSQNFLTVLNYHRIDDPFREGFDTFMPNISATPSNFALQMDYVAQRYNVISGSEFVSCIKGALQLPPRAAIITFDDGYYDNYTNAYPVLKARNLPALIFLATDFIGTKRPFFWDLIAYCFYHTEKERAELPYLGLQSWTDKATRNKVMYEWIKIIKKLPEAEKQRFVDKLPEVLAVAVPEDAFTNFTMSWSNAIELSENAIEMGGHTASHPILTRISLEEARAEISKSKQRIEEEINKPVLSFAYPNGQTADFNTK